MISARLLLAAALMVTTAADGQTFDGRVVRVVDGDTFDLLTAEKIRWRGRLAEIDAPEISQPYGKESRAALAGIVLRQPVSFRLTALDKRGRMIGRTTVGNGHSAVDVSAVLVQHSAAWAYLDYLTDQRFLMWERAARQRMLGFWALPVEHQVAP